MSIRSFVAAAAAATLAAPASAQPGGMVSAADPPGLSRVLQVAGYKPELGTDDQGDPKIELEIAGYKATMYFYGCDETTHKGCDSVQLRAGFDRDQAWTAADAIALSQKYRFLAVSLDSEGDPYINWDIVTGEGIPAKVFLLGAQKFGDTLDLASEMIFADE